MDFEKVTNKQIPEELIMMLIKNAHRAPSAGHTQVQEFIIVKDRKKKKLRKVVLDRTLHFNRAIANVQSST